MCEFAVYLMFDAVWLFFIIRVCSLSISKKEKQTAVWLQVVLQEHHQDRSRAAAETGGLYQHVMTPMWTCVHFVSTCLSFFVVVRTKKEDLWCGSRVKEEFTQSPFTPRHLGEVFTNHTKSTTWNDVYVLHLAVYVYVGSVQGVTSDIIRSKPVSVENSTWLKNTHSRPYLRWSATTNTTLQVKETQQHSRTPLH